MLWKKFHQQFKISHETSIGMHYLHLDQLLCSFHYHCGAVFPWLPCDAVLVVSALMDGGVEATAMNCVLVMGSVWVVEHVLLILNESIAVCGGFSGIMSDDDKVSCDMVLVGWNF